MKVLKANGERTLTVLKTLRSYTDQARFLALVDGDDDEADVRYAPRFVGSPYHFSASLVVYTWNGKNVVMVETSHRIFKVIEVPADVPIFATMEEAQDAKLKEKA